MRKALRIVLIVAAAVVALAAVNFAPLVSLKTPRMRRYEAHGITVYAEPKDAAEVEPIAAAIAAQSARIVSALSSGTREPVDVILYPSRKALHRKTIGLAGVLLPDWFVGDNTGRSVLITSPANPGPAHSRESLTKAAVHEYVHVITDRRNRSLGYWLKEGLALYLAGQTPEVGTIRSTRDVAFADFANTNAIRFAEVGGYSLAYTLIAYLTDTYGWEKVVALTSAGASYASVLGRSQEELFRDWKASLAGI